MFATVARALGPDLAPVARQFILHCLVTSLRVATAAGTARDLGIPYRTLASRLQRALVAGPHQLLSISKCLVASWAIAVEHHTVEQAASDAGFRKPATLRHALHRYFAVTPSEIRLGGGRAYRDLMAALPKTLTHPWR